MADDDYIITISRKDKYIKATVSADVVTGAKINILAETAKVVAEAFLLEEKSQQEELDNG